MQMRSMMWTRLIRLIVLVGIAFFFASIPSLAALPSESLVTAPLVTPSDAWSAYGSGTTHTNGVAAWAQRPPEIQTLSRALGAGRYSAAQYTQNVFEYVRSNIAIEFRFGLSKGARGALIEQSGTAFDQANLMVELLRQGGVTANYQVGTIALSAQQFGQWSGFIKNLNQSTQTFDVDAQAACQFIADGGIPAIVNGASDCNTLSGNLPTSGTPLQMAHIWVAANGNLYDPSFKPHTFKSGVDIAAAMQCGTSSAPTCGATANSAAMAGSTAGTFHGVPSIQHVNESGIASQLQTWATNVENYIHTNQPNAWLDDIVGGSRIDATYNPAIGASLPYASTAQYTWTGDIPDQFRTTLTIQFLELTQLFYADELAGKRIQLGQEFISGVNSRVVQADGVTIASAPCTATCSAVYDPNGGFYLPATVFLSADHPYVALAGHYADDTATGNIPQENAPLSIIQSWGDSAPAYQSHFSDLPLDGAGEEDQFREQSTVGAQFIVQQSAMHAMLGQIAGTPITRHHTLGVVFAIYLGGPFSNANFTIQYTASANSRVNDSAGRTATFETSSVLSAMLEGSIIQQMLDGWEQQSGIGLFVLANRSGRTFINVPSANMASVIPSLTNYNANSSLDTPDRRPALQAAADEGYSLIIPTDGHSGTFLGNINLIVGPDYAYMPGKSGLLLYERVKGSSGAQASDPIAQAVQSVREADYSLKQKKYASVDPANGALNLTPPADIVAGTGDFPMSLPFQRRYNSNDSVREVYTGDLFVGFQLNYNGPGDDVSSHLGAGWAHNYEIAAKLNNNGLLSLGLNSAIDASSAIADIFALVDMYRAPAFDRRLTGDFASYWLGQQFISNAVTLSLPSRKVTFVRLPDGTLHAPPGSSERLTQTGARSASPIFFDPALFVFDYTSVALTYTDAGGSIMSFNGAGNQCASNTAFVCWGLAKFKPTNWSFATGVQLTFQYQFDNSDITAPHYVLTGVSNSLGRSLTFSVLQLGDPLGDTYRDWRITGVTDDSGRQSTYGLADCPIVEIPSVGFVFTTLACNTFTATTPSGQPSRYGYVAAADSPDPVLPLRPLYHLRRWFTPSDTVNAFETVAYDDLFHVKSLTDKLAHQSQYFVGGLFDELLKRSDTVDPMAALATNWFDRRNSLLKAVDPLGRTTTNQYDDLERLILTTYPESNTAARTYDVRSNMLTVTRHAKPGSSLTDIVTSTAYVEGTAVLDCANLATCNKPATSTAGNGTVSAFSLDSASGLLTQILGGLNASLVCQLADGVCPQTDLAYTAFSGTGGSSFKLLTGKTQKISASQSLVTSYVYNTGNKFVLQSGSVDPSGLNLTTSFTFDTAGNITAIDGPRTDVTDISNYVWDADRRLTFVIQADPDGAGVNPRPATHYIYDIDGQLAETDRGTTTSGTGSDFAAALAVTFAYDAAGNKIKVTTPTSVTQFSYDADDRPLCGAVRMNPAVFASLPLDACSLSTTGVFGNDRITKTIYDAAGQSLQELRAFGTSSQQAYTTNTYTLNGKLLSITDSNGPTHVTNYVYDGFDRLASTVFADASHEDLAYDTDDNAVSRTTRAGQTLTYDYDALDRIAKKFIPLSSESNAHAITWTYTVDGRVAEVEDEAGQALVSIFDSAGRQTDDIQTVLAGGGSEHVSWQLDAAGNRTRLTWPDGYFATYVYDALNHPTSVTDSDGTVLASYLYDDQARRRSLQYAGTGGAVITYTWSPEDDLLTLAHDFAGTTNDVTYTNSFSPAHQLASEATSNASYLWQPPANASDSYAPVNPLNQYPSLNGGALTWDGNGNLLTSDTWTYGHDPENRLVHARTADGNADLTTLTDPLGRRTVKALTFADNGPTRFVYASDAEIGEYSQFGGLIRRFVPGPAIDEYVAMIQPPFEGGAPVTKTFFHANRQNSVVSMSDVNGNLVEGPYAYDASGNCFVATASCVSVDPLVNAARVPFRFTGQRYDAETNLYYYRARYYCVALGRFCETDPVGYGPDIDWYTYVGNDPTDESDPSGQIGEGCALGVAVTWETGPGLLGGCAVGELIVDLAGAGLLGLGVWVATGPNNSAPENGSALNLTNYRPPADTYGTPHDPNDPFNWKDYAQTSSRTVWKARPNGPRELKGARLDVENPNPSQRPGQIQFQIQRGNVKNTWLYRGNGQWQAIGRNARELTSSELKAMNAQQDLLKQLQELERQLLTNGGR
ncbi:MAG TPA: RHS repeat-associated core domain-containing protein [Rhizomicrobium sp.]